MPGRWLLIHGTIQEIVGTNAGKTSRRERNSENALRSDEERKRIAGNGYRRCQADGYSYTERFRKLLGPMLGKHLDVNVIPKTPSDLMKSGNGSPETGIGDARPMVTHTRNDSGNCWDQCWENIST